MMLLLLMMMMVVVIVVVITMMLMMVIRRRRIAKIIRKCDSDDHEYSTAFVTTSRRYTIPVHSFITHI